MQYMGAVLDLNKTRNQSLSSAVPLLFVKHHGQYLLSTMLSTMDILYIKDIQYKLIL